MQTLFEMEIEDRERWFRGVVMEKNHLIMMDEKNLNNFMDTWTQETTYKKKPVMLWEKRKEESAFDIAKRMAYWKRSNPLKGESNRCWIVDHPDQLKDIKEPTKILAAQKQLRALGWRFKEIKVNTGMVRRWVKS